VEWVHVKRTREKWLGLLNAVINCWVPYSMWYFLTETLLASEEVFSSEELR
jgi:hypothetical protein